MRRIFLKLFLFFVFTSVACAQRKPLYKLPDEQPVTGKENEASPYLVGTDNGLFRVYSNGVADSLLSDVKVSQIVKVDQIDEEGKVSDKFYFVTSNGILSTTDLKEFKDCNSGLPFLTVKTYENGIKSLNQQPHLLKDLAVDPLDSKIIVTATKDAIYLSRDGGDSWKNIGSTSKRTAGMKAVAVAHMPIYAKDGSISGSEVVVFQSHPIYGFSYYRADAAKPVWTDVSAGFTIMKSLKQVDEISDIIPVVCKKDDGTAYCEVYCAQSYLPYMYRFNWSTKRAEVIYSGENQADTIDSLCQSNGNLIFVTPGKINTINLTDKTVTQLSGEKFNRWIKLMSSVKTAVNTAYVPTFYTDLETPLQLNELFLLNLDVPNTPYGVKADGRKALYASVYQMQNDKGIEKYKGIVNRNNLNAIVLDMKDDYGVLRFQPKSELLKKKGFVSAYKIDLDHFVEEYKKNGTYLIARIVVFKDKHLATYDKKQYAVWNASSNAPWVGIKSVEDKTDENGNVIGKNVSYYDENWVDPYCEEVWEYNVEIARELVERGFDEIQFDYIRFPTDGKNLNVVKYRWRDQGMDKESALVSFLKYARKNINAPIGVDIYGANGWYRSGTRTGQDVELMSDYVDVVCPMFYPSHFEQDFMEYGPVTERPYRIYFFGSYRNAIMGRNRIIVRPWVQAFYMGVRYDKAYYDKNYVKREIFGVRDGANQGYMYWNNSGGMYDDISPDPGTSDSPWKASEKDLQKRVPAYSTGNPKAESAEEKSEEEVAKENLKKKEMLSILQTVIELDAEKKTAGVVVPGLLKISPIVK